MQSPTDSRQIDQAYCKTYRRKQRQHSRFSGVLHNSKGLESISVRGSLSDPLVLAPSFMLGMSVVISNSFCSNVSLSRFIIILFERLSSSLMHWNSRQLFPEFYSFKWPMPFQLLPKHGRIEYPINMVFSHVFMTTI